MAVTAMTPFLKSFSFCDRFGSQRADGCQDESGKANQEARKLGKELSRFWFKSLAVAQFTRRGGQTFSELHGVNYATTIRAIADIWFPRACDFENTREKGLIRNPGTQERNERNS